MILNSKHRGYLLGENGRSLSLPHTSGNRVSVPCPKVKNAYKEPENGAIRKNSKKEVTAPSGRSEQSHLRKFKQPVNTEFFTEESQSCNFADRLEEPLEQRQETFPVTLAPSIYNKV